MSVVKPFLSLTNILLPNNQVQKPPSLEDHLPSDFDFELRVRGCDLIQFAGVLLKLPQVSIATAQLLYQRFFFIKSFVKYNFEVVAMAATFLASKIDESPRRPRDVINAFHHIRQLENREKIQPLILDQYYINVKSQVIKSERRILKELGFAVHAQHPHKLLIIYLQTLECERNQRLVQIAWNYLNDSYKTNVFMCYQPPSIACSSIFMAARHLQLPLPNNPPWYSIFNVTLEEIREICLSLFKLYTRPKLSLKIIDKTLTVARKLYEVNKSNFKDSPSDSVAPSSPTKLIKEATDAPLSQSSSAVDTKDTSPIQNSPSITNATSYKYDDRYAKSIQRKRDTGMDYERKRSRRHQKNKHSSPSISPKYKFNDDKKYEEYNNHQSKHKTSRHKPAQEPELDNLVLARQRQSLLYSIQEQKNKSTTKPGKPGDGEQKESINRTKDDKTKSRKDTLIIKKAVTKDQNHIGASDDSKVVKEKEINKNGIYLNNNANTNPTNVLSVIGQINTKTEKSKNQELDINFNPNRRTNTYVPEKKRIVISLKSSPKIKSPKHKNFINSDDVIPKKRHKKR